MGPGVGPGVAPHHRLGEVLVLEWVLQLVFQWILECVLELDRV